MSGTSHDGLDLAHCTFEEHEDKWKYRIIKAVTIPYPESWKQRLLSLPEADAEMIKRADLDLGDYIGAAVSDFIKQGSLHAGFIASHGHTIFHDPDRKITLQIGNGERIAKHCGITLINDFRSQDVAMGGQGAPLVPLGDRLLFSEYDYCLNLGGIANISYDEDGQRIAYDICPVNMVLDQLALKSGKAYDNKGSMAASGAIIPALLDQLEALPYYSQSGPRSLGREWVLENIFPLMRKYDQQGVENLLATFTEHIAIRISDTLQAKGSKKMLVTGGGVYNEFLVGRMKKHADASIIIPGPLLIEFKEAMIFAFLGLLRLRNEVNVLGSVTGSGKDHCSGTIINK